ncbi:hypothetical protein AGLY_013996 [Aphis glycines]|uniref:Uncharacterized protein n=1 Tax=Aphis glycines TaxID=307491 RepID=A0A6G0T4T1_APHGL|nr:hypothetical protein AGLY_013996 [Aphis glycines]
MHKFSSMKQMGVCMVVENHSIKEYRYIVDIIDGFWSDRISMTIILCTQIPLLRLVSFLSIILSSFRANLNKTFSENSLFLSTSNSDKQIRWNTLTSCIAIIGIDDVYLHNNIMYKANMYYEINGKQKFVTQQVLMYSRTSRHFTRDMATKIMKSIIKDSVLYKISPDRSSQSYSRELWLSFDGIKTILFFRTQCELLQSVCRRYRHGNHSLLAKFGD